MKLFLKVCVLLFISITVFAQEKDYALGANMMARGYQQSGFFDMSDPEAVNIKVSVWGWVRYPGKFTIPNYASVSDLISYAGGPLEGADLEDIRILRVNADSSQQLIKFTFNDIMYEGKLQTKFRRVPKLEAGDVLVLPGEPRLYFRDHFSIWMSIISVLTSLTILVLNIVK